MKSNQVNKICTVVFLSLCGTLCLLCRTSRTPTHTTLTRNPGSQPVTAHLDMYTVQLLYCFCLRVLRSLLALRELAFVCTA